jgi:hypothetical protein
MHGIFSVPSVTNPYQIGCYHHNGGSTPSVLTYDIPSGSSHNTANSRGLSLSNANVAVNRLVVASPHKWQ